MKARVKARVKAKAIVVVVVVAKGVKDLLPTSESTLDSRSILKSASIADVDAGGLQFLNHPVIEFEAVNG